jgi:hypothetical protein
LDGRDIKELDQGNQEVWGIKLWIMLVVRGSIPIP